MLKVKNHAGITVTKNCFCCKISIANAGKQVASAIMSYFLIKTAKHAWIEQCVRDWNDSFAAIFEPKLSFNRPSVHFYCFMSARLTPFLLGMYYSC